MYSREYLPDDGFEERSLGEHGRQRRGECLRARSALHDACHPNRVGRRARSFDYPGVSVRARCEGRRVVERLDNAPGRPHADFPRRVRPASSSANSFSSVWSAGSYSAVIRCPRPGAPAAPLCGVVAASRLAWAPGWRRALADGHATWRAEQRGWWMSRGRSAPLRSVQREPGSRSPGRSVCDRTGLSMSSQVTCGLYPSCSSSITHSTLGLIREAAL